MIWLYKVKNWIVAHKNWLILMGLFVLSYVLGRRSNQNYLEMANLAKDQYKKENEELERLQKAKQARDKRAEQKAKEFLAQNRKLAKSKLGLFIVICIYTFSLLFLMFWFVGT